MNYDCKLQFLIVGDSTVGKTSLLNRYNNGKFDEKYLATIGIDSFFKDVNLDGKTIRVKIWDTAGQERYKALTEGYFRNAQGVLIVYDVTNEETFEHLKYWIPSVKKHIDIKQIPAIILGNKIDETKREVTKEKATNYAKEEGIKYFETSAKDGTNVEESINYLVKKVMKININNEMEENSFKIGENNKKNETKKDKCCIND